MNLVINKYKLLILIFLFCLIGAISISLFLNLSNETYDSNTKKYILPPLPYKYNALEPYMDAETVKIHYSKHHQAYVDSLNKTLEDHNDLIGKPVEELLENLDKIPEQIRTDVRNFGGGHLNHSMFWPMMSPKGGGVPQGNLKTAIDKKFGSFDKFKDIFNEISKKLFGSGWTWLCVDKNKELIIKPYKDQDSPLTYGYIPILCLDVWEHAYYLKYQNRRVDYIQAWWNLVNWPHIEDNYNKAISKINSINNEK